MSDLQGVGFGSTVDLLSNAISGAGMEQNAVAENIANINTPNYHAQSVSFKDALAAAEGVPVSSDQLPLLVNSSRQFATPGAGGAPVPFDPQTTVDETDKMRVDGSNVDVDQQMGQLAENSSYSQTMAQLLQVQFMRLRQAISEQIS